MHAVTLQIWLDHDNFPPEQVPDRYSSRLERAFDVTDAHTVLEQQIELPFAPYQGLVLWLEDGEVSIKHVIYVHKEKRFLCEIEPEATGATSFEDVVKGYLRSGWNWRP